MSPNNTLVEMICLRSLNFLLLTFQLKKTVLTRSPVVWNTYLFYFCLEILQDLPSLHVLLKVSDYIPNLQLFCCRILQNILDVTMMRHCEVLLTEHWHFMQWYLHIIDSLINRLHSY